MSNKKFYNVSDLKREEKQRIIFWFEIFTTRQIMDWQKYTALGFELQFFRHVRFWKNVCIQKITFWFFLLRENDISCIFHPFLKSMI